ncbi:MAG: hypothetical protein V3T10_01245 [Candidatus Bathyarchaeia archaeon]
MQKTLRTLDEKETDLDARVKALQEKMASRDIKELEGKIDAKHDAISKLESKIKGLEESFKDMHEKPKEPVNAQEKPPETKSTEEQVVVMNPQIAQGPSQKQSESEDQKKKRRFF